ncbi:hypothetical protein ACUXV3_14240 [Roseobacteraceae bacterium NS-SX3]
MWKTPGKRRRRFKDGLYGFPASKQDHRQTANSRILPADSSSGDWDNFQGGDICTFPGLSQPYPQTGWNFCTAKTLVFLQRKEFSTPAALPALETFPRWG